MAAAVALQGRGHGAVPPREGDARAPGPGRHRPQGRELHVCMLCARSCPDWCIYIEGHKEKAPPRRPGGKERTVSALDRFDIDYSLCMYCGICVEVCPFEALFWSPEYEYSEPAHRRPAPRQGAPRRVDGDRARLRALRGGSEARSRRCRDDRRLLARGAERGRAPVLVAQNIAFGIIAAIMVFSAIRVVTTSNVVHAAVYLVMVLAGAPPSSSCSAPSSWPSPRCWSTSAPSWCSSCSG
jgi:Pyruvate/2-oxoacid:ferredoxin oxidoreductase delta subunit